MNVQSVRKKESLSLFNSAPEVCHRVWKYVKRKHRYLSHKAQKHGSFLRSTSSLGFEVVTLDDVEGQRFGKKEKEKEREKEKEKERERDF